MAQPIPINGEKNDNTKPNLSIKQDFYDRYKTNNEKLDSKLNPRMLTV